MEQVLELARNLSKVMHENKIYTDYNKAKEALKSDPELYKTVLEFRGSQFYDRLGELENASKSDFGTEKHLSKRYSDLMLNNIANNFFEKEREFITMYENVYKIIGSAIDVDLFGL